MRVTLFTLGTLSLLAMFAWIGIFSSSPALVVDIAGQGFSEPSFSAATNEDLTRGEQVRDRLVAAANRWDFLFQLAGWVSLAATSTVTLATGVFGKLDPPGAGRRSLGIITIGFLSALASVATLGGAYAKGESQAFRSGAVELTTALRRSVDELKEDPSQQQAVLLQLKPAIDLADR